MGNFILALVRFMIYHCAEPIRPTHGSFACGFPNPVEPEQTMSITETAVDASKRGAGKALLTNMILGLLSVLLVVVLLEMIASHIFDVTDKVVYEHLPSVGLRLQPNQEGWYIRDAVGGGEGIRAPFSVNGQGFNNPRDYSIGKSNSYRIAVVGDSFVEAFQVPFEESFFKVLEENLIDHGTDTEVLSFGISGYGTSQIYHLIQQYVLAYEPDFLIYLFIPNDVSDSAVCKRKKQWTQQYSGQGQGQPAPVPFQVYRQKWRNSALKNSALVRYLLYQRRLKERLIVWQKRRRDQPQRVASGPEPCDEEAWRIVDFLLGRMDALLRERGVPWLIAWQGDVKPSFNEATRTRLEQIVDARGLPYMDLTHAFAEDFEERGQPVRIEGDGHWNAVGHEVAGLALAEELLRRRDLSKADKFGDRHR